MAERPARHEAGDCIEQTSLNEAHETTVLGKENAGPWKR